MSTLFNDIKVKTNVPKNYNDLRVDHTTKVIEGRTYACGTVSKSLSFQSVKKNAWRAFEAFKNSQGSCITTINFWVDLSRAVFWRKSETYYLPLDAPAFIPSQDPNKPDMLVDVKAIESAKKAINLAPKGNAFAAMLKIPNAVKHNLEFGKFIAEKHYDLYPMLGDTCRKDENIALALLKKWNYFTPTLFEGYQNGNIDPELTKNREFIIKVYETGSNKIQKIDASFSGDKELAKMLIKHTSFAFPLFSDLQNDKEFILECLDIDGDVYSRLNEDMQKDSDIALYALRHKNINLRDIHQSHNNRVFLLQAVEIEPFIVCYPYNKQSLDKEVLQKAWEKNNKIFEHLSYEQRGKINRNLTA